MCIRQKQSSGSEKKVKKVFLKFLQNSQENTCTGASLLIKSLFTPVQVFLCECFDIFKKTYFKVQTIFGRPEAATGGAL